MWYEKRRKTVQIVNGLPTTAAITYGYNQEWSPARPSRSNDTMRPLTEAINRQLTAESSDKIANWYAQLVDFQAHPRPVICQLVS